MTANIGHRILMGVVRVYGFKDAVEAGMGLYLLRVELALFL